MTVVRQRGRIVSPPAPADFQSHLVEHAKRADRETVPSAPAPGRKLDNTTNRVRVAQRVHASDGTVRRAKRPVLLSAQGREAHPGRLAKGGR